MIRIFILPILLLLFLSGCVFTPIIVSRVDTNLPITTASQGVVVTNNTGEYILGIRRVPGSFYVEIGPGESAFVPDVPYLGRHEVVVVVSAIRDGKSFASRSEDYRFRSGRNRIYHWDVDRRDFRSYW